jgi:hypothetical protein
MAACEYASQRARDTNLLQAEQCAGPDATLVILTQPLWLELLLEVLQRAGLEVAGDAECVQAPAARLIQTAACCGCGVWVHILLLVSCSLSGIRCRCVLYARLAAASETIVAMHPTIAHVYLHIPESARRSRCLCTALLHGTCW